MQLPQGFVKQMRGMLGDEQYDEFRQALDTTPPVSIRINTAKASLQDTDGEPVEWCSSGRYLPARPQFTLDPLLHAGCYYVQEASSMWLDTVLAELMQTMHFAGHTALDLCAAPGGKTTLMLNALPDEWTVVANEVVGPRAQILRENIIKWGAPNCIVTNNAVSDFAALKLQFDIILCDAPCSGEGMFRKDPESIGEWSEENVMMCQRRQRDIVADIWDKLAAGGIFIYSTCTYNRLENEDNVQWICEQYGAELLMQRRFMPHITRGEGLFMAVLKKVDADTGSQKTKIKKSKNQPMPNVPKEIKAWVDNGSDFNFYQNADATYSAFPKQQSQILNDIAAGLHIIHYGITVAETKGKNKLQPAHSLAMSRQLNAAAFPTCELNHKDAIAYLRTESITLPVDIPMGYVLLTYAGHPLGFVNNLRSRANNLYPSAWRIRKSL